MLAFLAHLFVPRSSNNHRAKLLHNSTLALFILFLVGFQIVIGYFGQKGQVLGYAANIAPSEVIRLVNEKRKERGLSPLTENGTLSAAARAKGNHMISAGYWAHVAPDGTQPWRFFTNAGYKYRYAGENLARDFADPASAVAAWMASPSHRENMLSPKYKEIGIGVVEGSMKGTDTTIIVEFLGTKLGDRLPVQPVARTRATPVPRKVPARAPLAESTESTPVSSVTPFNITKNISFVVIAVLIGVLAVDTLVIERKKLFRPGGRAYAHFAFLGMILAIIIIAKVGEIL